MPHCSGLGWRRLLILTFVLHMQVTYMYEHEAYDRERSISAAHASARQDERREIETTGEGGQKLHMTALERFSVMQPPV